MDSPADGGEVNCTLQPATGVYDQLTIRLAKAFHKRRLAKLRAKLDPFSGEPFVDDRTAYPRLGELSPGKLDSLIDLLVVEQITAHMQRRTELVHLLAGELKVHLRDHWRPDSAWLAGYQKIQLAQLMAELRGPAYDAARETRKKSELVEALAVLFADAAEQKLDDKKLADRVNGWIPANLRDETMEVSDRPKSSNQRRASIRPPGVFLVNAIIVASSARSDDAITPVSARDSHHGHRPFYQNTCASCAI